MKIGHLRHRITIQKYEEYRNEWNEPIKEWVDWATVWASIEPISGREYWANVQIQAEVSHRIRIRYLPAVEPTMRVIFRGREFEIESIINWQERNIDLQLMCREKV